MARLAYHTPDTNEGSDTVTSRCLSLPSSLWRYVSGALGELTELSNWEPFGDMTPEEAVSIFQDAIDDMTECRMIGAVVPFMVGLIPDYALPLDGREIVAYYYDYSAETVVWHYKRLWEVAPESLKVEGAFTGTITLPDLRGKFVIASSGDYPLLSVGGEYAHALTVDEMPGHSHEYTPPIMNLDIEAPGAPDILAAGVGVSSLTSPVGGGQSHNNLPPYLALVYCIIAK